MQAKRLAALILQIALLTVSAGALGIDLTKDIAGAKDIPGIPRYDGSVIIGYQRGEFDEAVIPTGKWDATPGTRFWESSIRLEGRRTRILYIAPKGRSSLEVIRNYKAALEDLGYKALFECSGFRECGKGVDTFYSDETNGNKLTALNLQKNAFSETSVKDPRIYVGKAAKPEGDSYVFVFAAYQDNYHTPEAGDRVAVFLEEVLTTPMQDKMVMLKADELERGITEQGRVAVYGVYFDFDKAVIKSGSKAQLAEMAKVLKDKPDLAVYIVGHTDNKGGLEYNMDLSKRRAEAVAKALVSQFGIAAERMTPMGVASLAPMTSNATEQGRALNRRVEMVAR